MFNKILNVMWSPIQPKLTRPKLTRPRYIWKLWCPVIVVLLFPFLKTSSVGVQLEQRKLYTFVPFCKKRQNSTNMCKPILTHMGSSWPSIYRGTRTSRILRRHLWSWVFILICSSMNVTVGKCMCSVRFNLTSNWLTSQKNHIKRLIANRNSSPGN